jgi:4-amino-4-deoxy-L-arabinose transferase-like glycosyltransferase
MPVEGEVLVTHTEEHTAHRVPARVPALRTRKTLARAASLTLSPVVAVSAITLVALLVRLYRLDARGLWFDEFVSAWPVRFNTLDQVLAFVHVWLDHTPLSFVLTWLLRGLGGDEWALRLPFAVASTLTVPVIYFAGKAFAGRIVGILASLLFALSPFTVFYAQDVRPYSLLLLFTALQMLFAYRAATRARWFDWPLLALVTILNLYTGYLALVPTASALAFVGLALLGRALVVLSARRVHHPAHDTPLLSLAGHAVALLLTCAAVFAAYLPWLPTLQLFLNTPGLAFGRLPAEYNISPADVGTLLSGFGLDWLLAVLVCVALVGIVADALRGRFGLRLLFTVCWLVLPLAAFWWRSGPEILLLAPRYYAHLFPAVVLLAALGVEYLVRWLMLLLTFRQEHPVRVRPTLVWTFAVAILLVDAGPALARSYATPKTMPQDFRGAARLITAESPPGSLVLVLGMWGLTPSPAFLVDGLDYYLDLYKAPVNITDGSLLDRAPSGHLASPDEVVWGAVYVPVAREQLARANEMGLEVMPFEGLTLLRAAAPRGAPLEQAKLLLAWGSAIQPGLYATRALLDADFDRTGLGANILPSVSALADPGSTDQPERWAPGPGASLSPDGSAFMLDPSAAGGESLVSLHTTKPIPGTTYVVTFRCLANPPAEQRVSVRLLDAQGRWIDTYPRRESYLCPPSETEQKGAFAFALPTSATTTVIRLEAHGTTPARYDDIQIRPVR